MDGQLCLEFSDLVCEFCYCRSENDDEFNRSYSTILSLGLKIPAIENLAVVQVCS